MHSTQNTVSLKLRTFERLAKLSEPAFIVIPVYDEARDNFEMYAIHVVGDALEKALKRLAEIDAERRELGKNDKISFSRSKWWSRIPADHPTPLTDYFEGEIEKYRGDGTYAAKKTAELKQLGYSAENSYTMNVSFELTDEEEFYEGMLGLRPLKVTSFENFDHRFGLKRPLNIPPISHGEMTVAPNSGKKAIIRLQNTVTDECEDIPVFLSLPGIPIKDPKQIRFLIKVHQCNIYVSAKGTLKISIDEVADVKQTASDWYNMYHIFHCISAKKYDFSLLAEDYKPIWLIKEFNSHQIPKDMKDHIEFLDFKSKTAKNVMDKMGLSALPIGLDDIYDDQNVFSQIEALATIEDAPFSIEFKIMDSHAREVLLKESHILLLGSCLEVSGRYVAYAVPGRAKASLIENGVRIEANRCGEIRFQVIGDESSYDRFFDSAYRATKATIRCISEAPDFEGMKS